VYYTTIFGEGQPRRSPLSLGLPTIAEGTKVTVGRGASRVVGRLALLLLRLGRVRGQLLQTSLDTNRVDHEQVHFVSLLMRCEKCIIRPDWQKVNQLIGGGLASSLRAPRLGRSVRLRVPTRNYPTKVSATTCFLLELSRSQERGAEPIFMGSDEHLTLGLLTDLAHFVSFNVRC